MHDDFAETDDALPDVELPGREPAIGGELGEPGLWRTLAPAAVAIGRSRNSDGGAPVRPRVGAGVPRDFEPSDPQQVRHCREAACYQATHR